LLEGRREIKAGWAMPEEERDLERFVPSDFFHGLNIIT